ncbi:dolichyl pyrophosphate Man9GlcNAc2 alpha-1,3-glucosyltransferase, putative [Coccidioides posadasii C735 delta SOWgp]|uniref:Alpha-1,3-glucosyltransferase n=2 Tax=Coccidioides posadasii TaxID=199306 RepID=A0A0J6EUH8_COCPO|nr:dolichyl pyrophosphate Man9GlcNAc2 alpha-1,3-glucosyltransferase, putative [Coccidioides posadasii C735 delta SOWgp]EER28714.1 dolichyl pyrophosphate Man9GlcNAc2 alpha-1,3-glucosyltransferase, putative [Coccidioides posadasii C735 delta SOWgp]KMM64176.1 glucosyltransferase [Coccidioides posadasii RMSCC 3488]|eukprot:XP_003070859.1 dolichyl pyrophosphate Man9GlcNAc2 alpha-1,3-glucosyltransferase, putative [Coccidioides posadasii C735 delta SOWgp]
MFAMTSPRPSTPSSHRPRKKRRLLASASSSTNIDLITGPNTSEQSPAFPLVSFLWPARTGVSQWLILPIILMAVGLFRWAVGLWGYSGHGMPPMYGDFEAQRHWMELTVHLPISSWYFYDLNWWGLDYPPLTAYHSWLLGKVGSLIDPSWFALYVSRGIESPLLKVYMRATVVVSEYLVYIPAVVIFLRRYAREQRVNIWAASVALVAILMQPATILIDHGHFQYNTVMLGLVVAASESIIAKRRLWACVFFVGALGFKQMALYFAPVIFSYMLGSCFTPKLRLGRLLGISLITITAFALVFAPLIAGAVYDNYRGIPMPNSQPPLFQSLPISLNDSSWLYAPLLLLCQSIHRIFPFARGLFEDKVANMWCAIHTFYKLSRFSSSTLQKASLAATVLSIFIPCITIGRYPRPELLLFALANSAWGFFLCSFQVHEKSVLLPLLPMTLLLCGDGGLSKESRAWVGFSNTLGAWTLFPLLKREELRVPYFVVTLLWAYLLGLPPTSFDLYRNREGSRDLHIFTKLLHLGCYLSMIVWHVFDAFVPPPPTKPDLWVVLNALIGTSGFGLIYLWCTVKLVQGARFTAQAIESTHPRISNTKKKQ